jgi:hypothetical protein
MPLKLPPEFMGPRIILHPEMKAKLFDLLRKRYEEEVTPDSWNDLITSYKDDHVPEDFLNATNSIARDVVEKYIQENNIPIAGNRQIDDWADEIWDESQSFWGEISEVIKQNIDFTAKLINDSKKEIDEMFPSADNIFGVKATQLLIDLSFQNGVYGYTKVCNPSVVDIRRMINIAGQIVEEIFSTKVFNKELIIGEIYRLLDSFRRESSQEKSEFYNIHKNGKHLRSNEFMDNLKIVRNIRNSYSHGASTDQSQDDDFSKCVHALLFNKESVLSTLYKFIKEESDTK